MRGWLNRWRVWRAEMRSRRSAARLSRFLLRVEKRLESLRLKADCSQARFLEQHDQIERTIEQARFDLSDLERHEQLLQKETAALKERLSIAEEVTIPTLTQAHQLVLERVQAATAQEIRRKTELS